MDYSQRDIPGVGRSPGNSRALVQETEDICRRVLTFFYWERLSMAEIAERMNYKDADVAKNKKALASAA